MKYVQISAQLLNYSQLPNGETFFKRTIKFNSSRYLIEDRK